MIWGGGRRNRGIKRRRDSQGQGRQSVTEAFIPQTDAVRAPGCAAVPETESSSRRFLAEKTSQSLCLRDR